MHINPKIFREYDIRGVDGKDLSEPVAERLGMAFAAYLRGKKKHNCVVVGRDGRLTSKSYAAAIIDGLTGCGVNVIDIGRAPTGLTYFGMATLPVDGAIMITGSHNPKQYNGFKIGVGKTTIHGKEIQKLRKIAEAGRFPVARGPVTITRMDLTRKYMRRVTRDIKLHRKLRVVVDAGNGVGGILAVPLYEALNCEVIPLYCDSDGTFPNHHPDPTIPKSLKELVRTVKREKADLGIGLDGDADRIGVVDEKGTFIAGDRLLILFARAVLKDKPGATVVGDVKCTKILWDEIERLGGRAVMWKTGHSLIKEAMIEHKAQLAGEMSGHIFFKHRWYGFDDAIYAGARLLEILSRGTKPLSAHFASIPKMYATDEIRIDTTEDKKFGIVREATRYFKNDLGLNVNDIDGARIEFPYGWGLLRASNTSPALVMRCEADTPKRLKEIRSLIEGKLKELNR